MQLLLYRVLIVLFLLTALPSHHQQTYLPTLFMSLILLTLRSLL